MMLRDGMVGPPICRVEDFDPNPGVMMLLLRQRPLFFVGFGCGFGGMRLLALGKS